MAAGAEARRHRARRSHGRAWRRRSRRAIASSTSTAVSARPRSMMRITNSGIWSRPLFEVGLEGLGHARAQQDVKRRLPRSRTPAGARPPRPASATAPQSDSISSRVRFAARVQYGPRTSASRGGDRPAPMRERSGGTSSSNFGWLSVIAAGNRVDHEGRIGDVAGHHSRLVEQRRLPQDPGPGQ